MPGKTDPFDNLVFEVNCLGCGHVAFSLPYREGTHHTMTCHRCGEVTIAHVLPGGHVAVATFEQRAAALERIKSEVERVLNSWDVAAEERTHHYRRRIPLTHRRIDYEVDTLRFTTTSGAVDLVSNSYEEFEPDLATGVLEAYATVRLWSHGLLLAVALEQLSARVSFDDEDNELDQDRDLVSVRLPEVPTAVADLDGTLLVEPRVPPPSPKDTDAT